MTYEKWIEEYKPIKNTIDPNANMDGYMFETFGLELDRIHAENANQVWTIVDADGEWYLTSGYHYVNRMGYMITSVPHDKDIEVALDD